MVLLLVSTYIVIASKTEDNLGDKLELKFHVLFFPVFPQKIKKDKKREGKRRKDRDKELELKKIKILTYEMALQTLANTFWKRETKCFSLEMHLFCFLSF